MALGSLTSPLIGRLMDRYGAKPIMCSSLIIMCVGFVLRPFMTELWHWYALSALQFGALNGASILPAGRLVGLWFPKTRGRVMGMTMMGNNFGGLTLPILIGLSIGDNASWDVAYLYVAIAALIIAIFSFIIVKEPYIEKIELEIDEVRTEDLGDANWSVKKLLRNPTFYAITLAIMLGNFTYTTILGHVFVYLVDIDISETSAALCLTVLAGFGMLGKVILGYSTEKIQTRFVMMVCFMGQICGIILILLLGGGVGIWFAVALFGFFMGSFGALVPLLVQDSFGLRNFGTIMGYISVTTVISFGLGPIIAGLSYDLLGGYQAAFMLVAILFGIATFALYWAEGNQNINVQHARN
ncbi:MAG: putative arabinose efflux permease, MFS family [Chloroflexi bacterium]|nr:MAG: putative arabinose efflux permease, MFS family [Chloroflexota bacterium]